MVLQKQTAHKLTVNAPEVLATADIERDRLVVASLVSSSLIERLVNIACSRVVNSAMKEGVGASAKALMGDAQIHAASAR